MKKIQPARELYLLWIFLCLITTNGCAAQTRQDVIAYPKKLALTALPNGINPQFGLQAIGKVDGLRGSLCWAGSRSNGTVSQDTFGSQISILQRVDIEDGNIRQVKNFELPAYDRRAVSSILYPIFKGNRNVCFVRAMRGTSDVSSYHLYGLDLLAKKGTLQRDELFSSQRIEVSPSGSSYAFETRDPYSGEDYHLVVSIDGKYKIISQDPTTNDFSWSSRNTLIYSSFLRYSYKDGYPTNVKNYGYPDVYEDDLAGDVKMIKEGGYRSLLSSDGKHLASFTALIDPHDKEVNFDKINFNGRVGRVALVVYDMNKEESHAVTRIYEQFPTLFWSKDSSKLYVVENFYVFSKKTGFCRISEYNVITKHYKILCRLEQKGEASSYDDGKLLPYFVPVGIANDKDLISQVAVRAIGEGNQHVLAIDLETGVRKDIFTFTATATVNKVPMIDWINQF